MALTSHLPDQAGDRSTIRHGANSVEVKGGWQNQNGDSKPDPPPSYGGARRTRTHDRTADETDASPAHVDTDHPHPM
jgi:hypothetical protein